jgi:PadR family transcriptional regulator, regulatory protein PadR
MHSKELLKGTIEIIILKLLQENKRMYGYEMMQYAEKISEGRITISEGSMYVILHKLVKEGVLQTEEENIGKRIRIYYVLTTTGKKTAKAKLKDMQEFISSLQMVFHLPKLGLG